MYVSIDIDFAKYGIMVTERELEHLSSAVVDYHSKYVWHDSLETYTLVITDSPKMMRRVFYSEGTGYLSLDMPYDVRELAIALPFLAIQHMIFTDTKLLLSVAEKVNKYMYKYNDVARLIFYTVNASNAYIASAIFTSLFATAYLYLDMNDVDDRLTLAYLITKIRVYRFEIKMDRILKLYNEILDTVKEVVDKLGLKKHSVNEMIKHECVQILTRWNWKIAKPI